MTQEEKFKEAKRLYETANADQRYVLESLFPELKESEDERIRNLIYCLIRDRSDSKKLLEHNGVSVDEALAWLEKQGQNPTWSEEDETKIKSIIALLKSPAVCAMDGNKGIIDASIKYLKSLKYRVRLQPQWKPSEQDILLLERIFDGKLDPRDYQASLLSIIEQLKKKL